MDPEREKTELSSQRQRNGTKLRPSANLVWAFCLCLIVILFDGYTRRRDTQPDFSLRLEQSAMQSLQSRLEFLEIGMRFATADKTKLAANGSGGPDLAALAKIQPPVDRSREQLEEYVRKICEVSSRQTRFSFRDPQVWLLSQVGPENFDVLLEFYDRRLSYYFNRVLGAFAREEHKQAVIDAMRSSSRQDLVSLVIEKGWEADARESLISKLESQPRYLPPDWIKAIARLPDPPYEDLFEYLRTGMNKTQTYEALESLPNIDLDASIADVWARREGSDADLAAIALAHGHTDAIGELIGELPLALPTDRRRLRETIERHVPVRGGIAEMTAWFEVHKDLLRWDAGEREYYIEGDER